MLWKRAARGTGASSKIKRTNGTRNTKKRFHWQGKNKQSDPSRNKSGALKKTQVRRGGGLALPQYVLDNLIHRSLQTQMQRALEEMFENAAQDNPNIAEIQLKRLKILSTPRLMRGAYYYLNDPGDGNDQNSSMMAFEKHFLWNNAFELEVKVTTKKLGLVLPVRLYNVKLKGLLRILLTPLLDEPPGFGAIVTSFVNPPKVERLQMDVAGVERAIGKVPWLRDELLTQLDQAFRDNLVWPKRTVQPSLRPNPNSTLLDANQIEMLQHTDPFLRAELDEGKNGDSLSQQAVAPEEEDIEETEGGGTSGWLDILERVGQVFEND